MHRILRIERVIERYGKTRSPIYADIQAGLFVRPVKLGERAAGWPEKELDALIAARVAGATTDQIRRLVEQLHAQRISAMPALA
jgi:prophage regulatory protein